MNQTRVDVVHVDADHVVKERVTTDSGTFMGDPCQVILYNDQKNTCEHVVQCLMDVFKHPAEMAKKIMWEAHEKGKTIAQVETRSRAIYHAGLLAKAGLKADVETISGAGL